MTDTLFFVPGGGEVKATTRGFGVVFTDVDLPDGERRPRPQAGKQTRAGTLIEFFSADGERIYSAASRPHHPEMAI